MSTPLLSTALRIGPPVFAADRVTEGWLAQTFIEAFMEAGVAAPPSKGSTSWWLHDLVGDIPEHATDVPMLVENSWWRDPETGDLVATLQVPRTIRPSAVLTALPLLEEKLSSDGEDTQVYINDTAISVEDWPDDYALPVRLCLGRCRRLGGIH